jgi:hypothetical protein
MYKVRIPIRKHITKGMIDNQSDKSYERTASEMNTE